MKNFDKMSNQDVNEIRQQQKSKENQEQILENINQLRSLAISTLVLLQKENENGKQFDYCNSPRMSDNFDNLQSTLSRIDKIIYQK
jgi:hypothetical protein